MMSTRNNGISNSDVINISGAHMIYYKRHTKISNLSGQKSGFQKWYLCTPPQKTADLNIIHGCESDHAHESTKMRPKHQSASQAPECVPSTETWKFWFQTKTRIFWKNHILAKNPHFWKLRVLEKSVIFGENHDF